MRHCINKNGNITRAHVFANLDLPEDEDIISIDMSELESDAVMSIIEEEGFFAKATFAMEYAMPITSSSWQVQVTLPEQQEQCSHSWLDNGPTESNNEKCGIYKNRTTERARSNCQTCDLNICLMYAYTYYGSKKPHLKHCCHISYSQWPRVSTLSNN